MLEPENVITPVNQVFQKSHNERRAEAEAVVAGIRRHAVNQSQQRYLLTLGMKFPCHFVSNVATEAIAAEAIRPVGLKCPQFGDVSSRYFFDGVGFLGAVGTTRFEGIDRLVGREPLPQS